MANLRFHAWCVVIGVSLVAGCGSGGHAATPYAGPAVTPERERMTTWTDREMDGGGYRIYIRNNTATPLRITSLELYNCENVDQPCLPMDPGIVLGPGQTVVAMTVRPAVSTAAFRFAYRLNSDRVAAPSRPQPIDTWTEPERNRLGLRIFFRNNTAAPFRLTSIELYDCVNVAQECAASDPGVVLGPGQSVLAMTVLPRLANFEFSFRYRYRTRRGS